MKKNFSLNLRGAIALGLFLSSNLLLSQTATVFNDDFSTPANAVYTVANGPITDSPTWIMSRSGADFGAGILNRLVLTNDGTNGSNSNGWVLAYTTVSNFSAPYNSTLVNNPGPVTWSFNMRQIRTNPAGFLTNNFGTAFILAGTSGTTNVTGTGYAIVLGNSGSIDPIRLVRYTSGIRTHTTLLSSNTSGMTDFGNQYLSIRVVYTPSSNTWQLFLRNDGTTAFADPTAGTLTSQGSVVNSNHTNIALPIMGGYFNGGTAASQTAFFDNVRVTVGVPFITSIAPNSRVAGSGAFTLTVNGQNFSTSSIVRWNGNNRTTTYISPTQLTVSIPATDIITAGTATVTVANGTTISNSSIFTIDPAGIPNLSVSTPSLNLATSVTGTPSASSSYTITGTNLTADPVVTAPANFEVSLNNTNFFPSLTLPRTGGAISGQPLTIHVRTTAAAASGFYNVDINNTSNGATAKLVSISTKVLATQPSVASAVNFTGITSTSFTVNWTNGNGSQRLLLIRQAGAVNSLPVDGQSYTAAAVFGSGSEIGTGNFVVYSGSGNSATVTGLSPSTNYHVSVVEFNGSGGLENYTNTGAVGNTNTLATPVGWQIYTQNTVNTITFDATVDGVNNDVFQGDGVAPIAETGQLSSQAWAFTGFSSGALAFGGTSPEDSSYDQGTSTGGVSDGGLYAFETQPDNFSLGIQPATDNFAPGTVTLRIQNRTGVTVTSFNIGYKVYVYNDQPSSSNFNMSYSVNNTTYTTVPSLNVISPAAADETPQWKAYYRVVTVPVSVSNNGHFFLRWNSVTVSGSGDFDEFALDDIVVIANPTASFAPFSGIAESFVVGGNAIQSSDLEIVGNLTFNGGKLDISANTLTSRGSITNTTAGGIKGGPSSNLVIGGTLNNSLSFDQVTVGTTNLLNNLTVTTSSNNITTITNPLVVNGGLNVASDQTLNMGTNALTGALVTATVNGTLQTSNSSATPLPVGKTWSGSGTVHYNATAAAQTVVSGVYNGLTVSSSGGTVAGGALTVNGALHLPTANPSATLGSFSTGTYELLMGGNATNTGVGDVTGIVARNSIVPNTLYTFGHAHTSILFPNIGTMPTTMGLKIQIGTAPTWLPGAIRRIYDLRQTGGNNTKAIIKAHYLDSELNGNNEAALVDYVHFVSTSTTVEQGRSNFNTVENWIELTNVNVGLFFQPIFDQVKLTLDEAAASVLTWNGSLSDSWTTAENWTPQATPSDNTIVFIPDAATTENDPIINSNTLIGKVNILAGGILNTPPNSQLTVHGGAGAWINNGIFNPGTGNVSFVNLDATIAGETNFNNVTIPSGGGLRPLTGNIMHIAGTFTRVGNFTPGAFENTVDFTGTNQVIPTPLLGLAAYNSLIITGSGAVFPSSLGITGNLTLNNTVDFSGKTIVMKGSTSQTIGGTTSPVFNNLTIENTSGNVSMDLNVAVNGSLTLNSGQLVVSNSRILTLGTTPVAGTFNASTMITIEGSGKVRRPYTAVGSYFFPIGENTSPAYSPIQVDITAGSFSVGSYVEASVTDGIHPNNASAQNHLTRYWNVTQSGIANAIATINATYLPADLSSDTSTIAAAKLSGVFNLATNPWVKYEPLSGTTLSIVETPLTSGVVSAFTGIKAGDFTTDITGYGDFCEDDAVTLSAITSGGDGPYSYNWSDGLGTQSTATPPTSNFGTITYSLVVRDANGLVANDQTDVTVLTESLGGTLSASQNVCLRTAPEDIILTGHTGNVLYWQRSEDPAFPSEVTTNISNFTDILTGEVAGIVLATTYFRAVISNGNCGEVYSGTTSAIIQTTTWNGAWTPSAPNAFSNVIITENFIPSADLEACSITIQDNANVTIPSDITLTLNGAIIISSGNFTVEDDASVVQTNDSSQNLGTNFTMIRETEPMYRYDFTYWSSPVKNQTLHNLSPITLFDKYFGWNPNNQSWIPYHYGVQIMQAGAGYIVRAPQNFSTNPLMSTPFEGVFTGEPHNGIITIPVAGNDGFNLLGNPYPSAINADTFILDPNNSSLDGTIYLWTHNTPLVSSGGQSYSYSADDYAVYNLLGGTGTSAAPSETFPDASNIPNGFIAAGQGFFIQGLTDGTATFNNAMRVTGNNNQFFRFAPSLQKHRFWMSISNTRGFKQLLIGYAANATNGFDRGWDGKLMETSTLDFYTFVDGKKLSIQSFGLPFDVTQTIAVGYSTNVAGNHSISLNDSDGLLIDQEIFLLDKFLDITHDLKASNYEFSTQAGTFDDRFEIVYLNTALGNPDHANQNGIIIYNDGESVSVKSPLHEINTIRIIDMQGRILYNLDEVNSNQVTFDLDLPNQVLIVSVTNKNGTWYNKKIIH